MLLFLLLFLLLFGLIALAIPPSLPRYLKNRVFLSFEGLEDRLVPSNSWLWIAPNGGNFSQGADWINVNNMQNGVPVQGDILIFNQNMTVGGQPGQNTAATDDISNLGISSIFIDPSYTATITLNTNLKIGQAADGTQNNSATSGMGGGNFAATGPNLGGQPVGSLEIYGGTFNWSGGAWNENNITTPTATVDSGSTLNISGSVIEEFGLTDNGTVNLSGGMQLGGFGGINIGANHSFQVSGGGISYEQGSSGLTISNSGNFTDSGANLITIAPGFRNQGGNLNVNSGTLQFQTSISQTSGTTTIANGATLGTGGTYTVSGGTISGSSGTSTLGGNLTLSGGTFYVSGQGNIGTFVVTNNYTQTGGSLVVDINAQAGTNDLLQVMNQANLGGNLTVNSPNGKPAAAVTIIFYQNGHTGNFATFTYNNNVNYTPDTSDPQRYKLT